MHFLSKEKISDDIISFSLLIAAKMEVNCFVKVNSLV